MTGQARSGKRQHRVSCIAAEIRDGWTAKVVGGEPLVGTAIRFYEVDGVAVQEEVPPRLAQPGVHVTSPYGVRVLYATLTREDAVALLADAEDSLR